MGHFVAVSAEDEEEEEESRALVGAEGGAVEPSGSPLKHGIARFRDRGRSEDLWLGCLTTRESSVLLLAGLLVCVVGCFAASALVNSLARRSLEQVATAALGVETRVGSVSLGVLNSRSVVQGLAVRNPHGFSRGVGHRDRADFLDLDQGAFNLRLFSLLSSRWELEEISLRSFRVNFEQASLADSNAGRILAHLEAVSNGGSSGSVGIGAAAEGAADGKASTPAPSSPGDKQAMAVPLARIHAARAIPNKILADELSMRNVSVSVCVHPMCGSTPPPVFRIPHVLVKDIGKESGGVHLSELLEIIVQAIVFAAIHSVPKQLGLAMHRSIGDGLQRIVDYASVHYDVGGGLQRIRAWTAKELSVLSRTIQAATSAVAPAGVQDKDIVNDLAAATSNFSAAMSTYGKLLGDEVASMRHGEQWGEQAASQEQRAERAAELAAENLQRAGQEGWNETATIAKNVVGALLPSKDTFSRTGINSNIANVQADAARVAEDAWKAFVPQESGGHDQAQALRAEAGKALQQAEQSLEKATGFEQELLSSLLADRRPKAATAANVGEVYE